MGTDAFWKQASTLLRWRTQLVLAFFFAFVSAGGIGAGILATLPIIETVMEPGHEGLPRLARELNEHRFVNGAIDEATIEALPSGAFEAVLVIMGALGVLAVLGAAANFMHQYLALGVVARGVERIRRRAFAHVIHLPLKTVVAEGPTDTISRIVNDTEALANGFTALLSKVVAHLTKGLIAVVAAFIINWQLALAAMVVLPLLGVVIRKIGKRIHRASQRSLMSRAGLYRAATESLQGLRVVKVHTTERYETGRFARINKEFLAQALRIRTARAVAGPAVELISMVVLGALIVFGVKLIEDGVLRLNEVMATLGGLGLAAGSIKPVTGLFNEIHQSSAAAQRLGHLLREPEEPGHERSLSKLGRHRESIVFDDVSFVYPGATMPALRRVSLRIDAGETVAFVGPNGCGKTTLLSLVPRLFDPDRGRVLIDGVDLTRVRVRSVREQIGVVTQEVVLFKGTILDNIRYGSPGATREQVEHAARDARAWSFIGELDQGLDTPVGEQGLTLSGGQRQRIAIARAILRDPSILVLDEATSMIDASTERDIGDVMGSFCSGRTTLIVAHRLSTVLGADRIVVMDEGAVVAQGTHDDLLSSCALYRDLSRHQLAPRPGGHA